MKSIEGPRQSGSIVRKIVEKLPLVKKRKELELKNELESQLITKIISDIESDGYTVLRHFENPDTNYTSDIINSHIVYITGEQLYDVYLTAVKDISKKFSSHKLEIYIDQNVDWKSADTVEGIKGSIGRQVISTPSEKDAKKEEKDEYESARFYTSTKRKINEQTTAFGHKYLSVAETNEFIKLLLGADVDAQAVQKSYDEKSQNLSSDAEFFREDQTLYWNKDFPGRMFQFLNQ